MLWCNPASSLFVAAMFVVSLATACGDDPKKQDSKPFRDRIVLIGCRMADEPKATLIRTMAQTGRTFARSCD